MKLVLTYQESDHCTYSYDIIIPFEYESKAKAEYDLYEEWQRIGKETEILEKYRNKQPDVYEKKERWIEYNKNIPDINEVITLGTIPDLRAYDFTTWKDNGDKYLKTREYNEPSILTLEEWFDQNKQ